MLPRIKNCVPFISLAVLGVYFFFLAAYSKKFAYLNFTIGPIPIFISEMILFLILGLNFFAIKRNFQGQPKPFLGLIVAFVVFGFFRLLLSIDSGVFPEYGVVPVLKQTCLFYQVLWIFVPFAFSRLSYKKLISAILLGLSIAQLLGWIGFLLMGTYSPTTSKLIGFPVGNEAMLPLYLFSILIFGPIISAPQISVYGLLWLTQFILYMKRNWVFSVLFFTLPLVLWAVRFEKRKKLSVLIGATFFGFLLAMFTVRHVRERESPVFYHISDYNLATEQREKLTPLLLHVLRLLDGIYQNTDAFDPNVSVKQIIFKGDLVPGTASLSPFSTMAFRLHFWKQAWEGFLKSPIIGQGFGPHYAETQLNGLPAMFEGKWVSGPHNGYLAIINRMGIIGGLLFVLIIFVPLFRWFRFGDRDLISMVSVASFLSINFFVLFNVCLEHPQGAVWYWFFLGIILNSTKLQKAETQFQLN